MKGSAALPSASRSLPVEGRVGVTKFSRVPAYNPGMKRVRADREKLRAQVLLGEDGKLRLAELPRDMQPGSERDFGG
jgi:hypothetical protein